MRTIISKSRCTTSLFGWSLNERIERNGPTLEEAKNMAINSPVSFIEFEGETTPARVFRKRCHAWREKPALRKKEKGLWTTFNWKSYYQHAQAIGLALHHWGLKRADVVCILAENRPEWLFADMAAQCMGLISNGIYPTSSPAQVQYILLNSETRILFVENQEQLEKVLAVRSQCLHLQKIIVMEREGLRDLSDPDIVFFDNFLILGQGLIPSNALIFENAIDQSKPEDIAFLVYTSGTTGPPKGAMITNRNVVFQLSRAHEYLDVDVGDQSISFLPLCHIAERMASIFNPLAVGLIVHFPENSQTVFNDMREVSPHVVFAPPRFWEKMYSQIDLFMRDAIVPARWIYQRSSRLDDSKPSLFQSFLQWICFRNIRLFLGLHHIKTALTGAAPVPPDLIRWFGRCGIELREAYGMTETTGFCTATPKGGIRLGWAGIRASDTELTIGQDKEILIRGDHVFAGYWKMPEQTALALDAQGWLHTGDCGEISSDGYLAIQDRIKDILITSGGKNITPSHIESLLKFSPYITDAVIIGDGQKYITALVMIDQEHVARYAREQQIPYTNFLSLTQAPGIHSLIQSEIENINPSLARVEQIKDFRIIGELLTAEDEELTPTMKLKRKVIAQKYAPLIQSMYENN
ncbi:MAG: long-chain fatty acid--CoA ligase [Limnohabitans sp.]|nr:long-chain fatty acid--CoA ligase [Limnohabitans sp.]